MAAKAKLDLFVNSSLLEKHSYLQKASTSQPDAVHLTNRIRKHVNLLAFCPHISTAIKTEKRSSRNHSTLCVVCIIGYINFSSRLAASPDNKYNLGTEDSLKGCFKVSPAEILDGNTINVEDDENPLRTGFDGHVRVEELLEKENFPTTEEVENKGEYVKVIIQKTATNTRRISATIPIEAPLEVVWSVLTDYENLVDFIPGLAVSQLIERWDQGARLLQVAQQDLAFGLKFRAKGVLDICETPVEILPYGVRRTIEFKMIEGDFQVFQGTWSMEQVVETDLGNLKALKETGGPTCLSYIVNVKPKYWLPVHLVESRLCSEIQVNLACVQEQVIKCIASLHA
eukprot:c23590_g1_i1 orf=1595-2620(+)